VSVRGTLIGSVTPVAILAVVAGGLALVDEQIEDPLLRKIFYTVLWLVILIVLFKLVIQTVIDRTVKDSRSLYSARKANTIILYVVALAVTVNIWVEETETLLVSYGIIAAGVAIALQDFFKNFVGGVSIMANSLFRVGDRVEMAGKKGDVVDIGILYTTLAEVDEWVWGDSPTGRLSMVPNGVVLKDIVNNYTKDNTFLWDEIMIPLTFESDWRAARESVRALVMEETRDTTELARKQLGKAEGKYFFPSWALEPAVFVRLTDNWMQLEARYVTEVRERRRIKSLLTDRIVSLLEGMKGVQLASETMTVTLESGKTFIGPGGHSKRS